MARVWVFYPFLLIFTFWQTAHADCASPSAVAGQFQFFLSQFSSAYKYCDGTNWQTMAVADTGSACGKQEGVLTLMGAPSDLQFCDGNRWISVTGVKASSCTGTPVGTIQWMALESRLKWCDGTNWNIIGALGLPDPCAGKSVGQACNGTTALYAGTFDGGSYMIMPSGCADDTSDPTCSGGTDTVEKTWNDGTTNYSDVPQITNVTSDSMPSSSTERGEYTTPILAAIINPVDGGAHAAARFCSDMVYGGYDDWVLPSKSELAFIYCNSNPSFHLTNNPTENPNCGGGGPSRKLTGFASSAYWSSTESYGDDAWRMTFTVGSAGYGGEKHAAEFVRCVRRYIP